MTRISQMAGGVTPLWKLAFLVVIFHWVLAESALALSDEGKILLEFAATMDDEDGALASWNSSDALPCSWNGVTCDGSNHITQIFLSNANLSGPVPSVVCQLPMLTSLVLSLNYLNGTLPVGLLNCTQLQFLDLSYNFIVSPLPDGISKLQSLVSLDLSYNNFSGIIPRSMGDLPALQRLNLMANLLDGPIPPELGNLTNLQVMVLDINYFTGTLPNELGNLKHLEHLTISWSAMGGPIPPSLGETNLTVLSLVGLSLTGSIPSELGKLQRLQSLDLSRNSLTGTIPTELMYFPELTRFLLWKNNFTGPIPSEIGNLTALQQFDVSNNQFSGSIPTALSQISNLGLIQASTNRLTGPIPEGFGSLPNLYQLKLFDNQLSGPIPQFLGESSGLVNLDLSTNSLIGTMPPNLCSAGVLTDLILFENNLSGALPDSLGTCFSLQRIRLETNFFTGPVPVGLWASPNVTLFYLQNNFLEGTIGVDIGKASALESLLLDNNRFTGSLPAEIGSIPNLNVFSASGNNLNGTLPPELGQLQKLNKLELGVNFLTGSIPVSLSLCQTLTILNLSSNHLVGEIPAQLGRLPTLNTLDLSRNDLSGPVPPELGTLQLTDYNFSYNNLSGVLPPPFNSSFLPSSFEGNPGLDLCIAGEGNCGIAMNRMISSKSSHGYLAWAMGATFATVGLMIFLGALCFWRRYYIQINYWKDRRRDQDLTWSLRSFQKVSFFQEEVMDSLEEDNLIGSGGAGKVYKAELSNGQVVAVKRLAARQDNGFSAEVETLGRIRHRNVVKLLCCCSNQESNLLVYEYMPNGSLGDYLHSAKGSSALDWGTRFKIAIGAAEGLAYLHHDCVPIIVHRDVKSNNILLDMDFEAHLADFGLAKAFESESMSAIAGSYGYIAPEYAYTLKVTEKSDIYSFGVVLLELVSGRRPIESEFGEMDIVRWVTKKIETKAGALEVLDGTLRAESQEDMMLVLKVGLLCTSYLPSNRPSMRNVVQMLSEACPRNQAPKISLLSQDCKVNIEPLFTPQEKS